MSTLLQLLSGILHGSILICIGCALFFSVSDVSVQVEWDILSLHYTL